MSELRTPEVENLLSVFAKLNDNDTVFALLEDLFTIRVGCGPSALFGQALFCDRRGYGRLGDDHRPRVEVPLIRVGRLRRRARGARR